MPVRVHHINKGTVKCDQLSRRCLVSERERGKKDCFAPSLPKAKIITSPLNKGTHSFNLPLISFKLKFYFQDSHNKFLSSNGIRKIAHVSRGHLDYDVIESKLGYVISLPTDLWWSRSIMFENLIFESLMSDFKIYLFVVELALWFVQRCRQHGGNNLCVPKAILSSRPCFSFKTLCYSRSVERRLAHLRAIVMISSAYFIIISFWFIFLSCRMALRNVD